jgi:DNA-binding LacI/PurR family transcriptional regulator
MARQSGTTRDRKDGPVTLQHISKKLGFSRTTISLALRNHPRISVAAKKRIVALARRMGYEPNQVARALATGRSNLVGVVVPNISDHVYADVFRGIEDAAQSLGYHLLLSNGSYDADHTVAKIREMMRLKVAGILAAPPFQSESSPLPPPWEEIKRLGFPFVLLNRELNPPVFDQVTIDNKNGIRMAMKALSSLGHKRIAYMTSSIDIIPIRQRYDSFREFISKYGFDTDPELVERCEPSTRGGYKSCAKLWTRLKKKPTAIMAFGDAPAIGIMRYLYERRVRVPMEVSVLGFDGTDSAEFSEISLSTVATPMYEMGKQAFGMLEDAMERHHVRPRSIILPVQLVLRESVARASSASSSGARTAGCVTPKFA